eukprot:CAMPEP_0194040620 /NCGR_PEP_ID=MMETSP0009_2-20130614/12585_1 /TAXON_ID=210454 /ORGANISM="Grammatophora oceanica, Strain CCMP 410" /LENGTH=1010 /DNA_ID=CAMNT_0038683811 /DNA_START=131 /DNA_END=3163 /DNA_ORIENTATION=+
MVHYGYAAAVLLALVQLSSLPDTADAFSPMSIVMRTTSSRGITSSLSAAFEGYLDDDPDYVGSALQSATESYLDSLTEIMSDADDEEEQALALKKKLVQERATTGTFTVSLPLNAGLGITVSQVDRGLSFSKLDLNLDTLKYQEPAESGTAADQGIAFVDPSSLKLGASFSGVVVNSVSKEGKGWASGVRPGDVLLSTSATVGPSMWPKSTMEGVRSAISSRKVVSPEMDFQFQRMEEGQAITAGRFEMKLPRPLGLQIKETEDGYVVVTGYTESASKLVRMAVQVGDRILAVGSVVGDKLWPVSTAEGVISACTSRLPGQSVTMRFERPAVLMDAPAVSSTTPTVEASTESLTTEGTTVTMTTAPRSASIQSVLTGTEKHQQLLSRCQDVLSRYMEGEAMFERSKYVGKYNIPGLVADKVLDAVATANASLDARTLALVMKAYMKSKKPISAIRTFEAAVGVKADGSVGPALAKVTGKESGSLVPNIKALNLYTASSLMRAFSISKDYGTVKRILSAMEGRCVGIVDGNGFETAAWPGVQPDSTAYNIALSAAARSGPLYLKEMTLLFKNMSDGADGRPRRDAVSYNTLIDALAKAGYHEKAFTAFYRMEDAKISPDTFTYTSLVRACESEADMQELLYDMKDKGLKPTVLIYNTMIQRLCDKGKWYDAKKLVGQMEGDGLKPTSMTYGWLMSGFTKAGKPGASLMLFEAANSNPNTAELTENVHLFTSAISAAAAMDDHERALSLVQRMQNAGVKPNIRTKTTVMTACLNAGKPNLAADVYRTIRKPDAAAYSKGMEALCASGDMEAAYRILTSKSVAGCLRGKRAMFAHRQLLGYSLAGGDFELARKVMTNLLPRYIPDKSIIDTIIRSLELTRVKNEVLASPKEITKEGFEFLFFLLDSLRGRDLYVTSDLYEAVLRAGGRMGGLRREMCSHLVKARAAAQKKLGTRLNGGGDDHPDDAVGWEYLLKNYDTYKGDLQNGSRLPKLNVKVSKKSIRQLREAEAAVVA